MKKTGVLRQGLAALCLFAAMAALLCFPKAASAAVVEGLELCGKRLLPALFPFFVCCDLLISLELTRFPQRLVGRIMTPLFGVPAQGAAALLLGAVGGYPAGARTVADLCRRGQLRQEDGERLLLFCNNAGPGFVIGVVGSLVFGSPLTGAALYAIHILSALLTGILLKKPPLPSGFSRLDEEKSQPAFASAFTSAVRRAGESALNVAMFVVVFCVLSRFLLALLPRCLPDWVRVLLCGMLELSNGAAILQEAALPLWRALPLAAFLLGFGGLGVWAQAASVLEGSGLRARGYLPAKALQGLLSALLALPFSQLLPPPTATVGAFFPYMPIQTAELSPLLPVILALAAPVVRFFLVFRKVMGSNSGTDGV